MLIQQVGKTIREHDLIEKNQHIVLGLSGGPDSVCLFHVLMSLRAQMEITIHPVHLNHKFRPGEAERDQRYTEELCDRMGVECRTFTVDCAAMARELSVTGEEAGRIARYDAFHETAEDIVSQLMAQGEDEWAARRSVKIAVAHNAGDQAETILFRLLRGTGTDGLAGIAYKRDERGFDVIRPLLDVDRKSIERYCADHGLEPVTDHTNNEAVYARNRIRLELLPFLEENYNENIQGVLLRLGRIAAEDKEYIWQAVERAYTDMAERKTGEKPGYRDAIVMDREKLSQAHGAIRHRLVMKAFGEIGLDSDISEERLKAADSIIGKKQAPKVVEFPRGYRLEVARGQVIFSKST